MENVLHNFSRVILLSGMISLAGLAGAATTSFSTYTAAHASGQDSTDVAGVFATHAVPKEYPYMEGNPKFNVAVNGAYVGLFNDENKPMAGNIAFGMFEFAPGREIEVEVALDTDAWSGGVQSFEVLPHNASFTMSPELTEGGRSIRFKTTKADQKLTFVINGNYKSHVLHLFCNSIDLNAPKVDLPEGENYKLDRRNKLFYFGAGYHKLASGKPYFAADGELNATGFRVYIAPGAVIDGAINATGATVDGRGLLMNAAKKMVLKQSWGNGGRVSGITIHGHHSGAWTTGVDNSKNVIWDNVNILSVRYASVDGIDLNYAVDCSFNNCFIRTHDDCIAIKALNMDRRQGPTKNLTFTNMQLWNDANNAFGLGAETNATEYSNISLKDSEILYSYDDFYNHEQLDERGAMNICCLQGTYFKDIVFENIYVNRCERLIGLGFKSDFWFGSIQGDQTTEGGINGVTFRNIKSPNNSGSSIANQIHLYGWKEDGTPDKWVENITFDNVSIEGKGLADANDSHFLVNDMVRNLHFMNAGVSVAEADGRTVDVRPTSVRAGQAVRIASAGYDTAWELYSLDGRRVSAGTGTEISTGGLSASLYLLRVTVSGQPMKTVKLQVK